MRTLAELVAQRPITILFLGTEDDFWSEAAGISGLEDMHDVKIEFCHGPESVLQAALDRMGAHKGVWGVAKYADAHGWDESHLVQVFTALSLVDARMDYGDSVQNETVTRIRDWIDANKKC